MLAMTLAGAYHYCIYSIIRYQPSQILIHVKMTVVYRTSHLHPVPHSVHSHTQTGAHAIEPHAQPLQGG